MLTAQLSFTANEVVLPKIIMPHGFIGFEEYQHYTMAPFFEDQPTNTFWMLKSLDHPDLSFVLMSVEATRIRDIEFSRQDLDSCCHSLGIKFDEIYLFLVVTFVPNEAGDVSITVNTRAPLIYHSLTGQAWQVVFPNPDYPIALKIK